MKKALFKWTELGNLMVGYSTEGQIPDDVWRRFIHDLKTKSFTKYLGASVGYLEVTSIQRKQVAEALKGKSVSLAVVTDEKLVRGIVTAASWLGINVKSFSWAEMNDAFNYLGVPSYLQGRATDAIEELRRECEEERRRTKGQ